MFPSPPRTVTEIPELDQNLYPAVPSSMTLKDQIDSFYYRGDINPVNVVLLSIFMQAAAIGGKWRCVSLAEMLAGIISVGDGRAAEVARPHAVTPFARAIQPHG